MLNSPLNGILGSLERSYALETYSVRQCPSNRNLVNIIDSDRGFFILKQYMRGYTRENVEFQVSVADRLVSMGYPTSKVERTIDGSPILVADGIFTLSGYIPGNDYAHPSVQDKAAASDNLFRMLGRWHSFLKDTSGYDGKCIHGPLPDNYVRQRFEAVRKIIEAKGSEDETDTGVLAVMERCQKHLQGIEEKIKPYFPSLTKSVLHFDFNKVNVLFDSQGNVTGIIDYDNVRLDFTALDLIHTINCWFFDKEDGTIDIDSSKRAFEMYSQEMETSDVDLRFMPEMLDFIAIDNLSRVLLEKYRGQDYNDYFKRAIWLFPAMMDMNEQKRDTIDKIFK